MRRILSILLTALLLCAPLRSPADTAEEPSLGDLFSAWLLDTRDLAGAFASEIGSELDAAGEAVGDALDEAQAYLDENLPIWTEEARMAWDALSGAALEAAGTVSEEAKAAYVSLRAWALEKAPAVREKLLELVDALGCAAGVSEARVAMVDRYVAQHGHGEILAAWETVQSTLSDPAAVTRENLDAAMERMRSWLSFSSDSAAGEVLRQLDALLRSEYQRSLQAFVSVNGSEGIQTAWANIEAALDSGEPIPQEDADALRAWFESLADEPSAAQWGFLEALLAE